MSAIQNKLKELGLTLPAPPEPAGSYTPVLLTDRLGYVSGQLSKDDQGRLIMGRVGTELSLEEGKTAAEWAVLNALSAIESVCGLDSLERIIRLTGYIQSAPAFHRLPEVLNGASDLLASLLGEAGRHARSAVGVSSLPLNAAVELELIVRLQPQGAQ